MPRVAKPAADSQMLSDYSRNVEYQSFSRKWDVEELCKRTGLTRNTIQRIRTNRHRSIDAYALSRFCEVFSVTPDELLLRREGIIY